MSHCSILFICWRVAKFIRWCHGSPVHRYGLYALQWIVEVNGKKTPDLDAFVDVTKVRTLDFIFYACSCDALLRFAQYIARDSIFVSPLVFFILYKLSCVWYLCFRIFSNFCNLALKCDQELEHGQFVRVRTVHLNGKPRVLTLKQDLHYWPTWELRFDPDSAIWGRKTIKALDYTSI